ncbi:lipopolysaccharide heptosyltransferase family protein [Vibrio sp. LQ2]|uniref:glycosyltransferase family 9 protein n=1 Tax=Vibrio TaxID=662 RepID=UPI001E2B5AAC|nr:MULTISPECIES: glycosyltransferase family 9 protein [Vibrio]USP06040.1 lipopolysaccharide heptosyltransferase family protein [Vibrio sp. LQ2]
MMQMVGENPKLRIKNHLRKFDRYRKNKMSNIANLMLSAVGNHRYSQSSLITADEVKEILIVRSNDRVGNTVFLIPFIRQVQHHYPNANITLLLNKRWQQDVFANMGIETFEFANLSFSSLSQCVKSVRSLRKRVFDLCLSPSVSAQSSVLCSLMSARNKISYTSRYDNAFTHTFPVHKVYSHAALCNLSLLPQLHSSELLVNPWNSHQISISEEECRQGFEAKGALADDESLCLTFFRGARGDKKLTDVEWLNILRQFERAHHQPITWIEIMGPEIEAPLCRNIQTYRSKSLRELACFLRHTDGFISCDTGPLHLADAAGASCIGLYTHTDPAVYGLLGERCFHVTDLDNIDAATILQALESAKVLPQAA